MSDSTSITTLFLDIGGVLLTNGWDRYARAKAAEEFDLDIDELNQRHHLIFDAFECGTLSLDEYSERTVFYQQRPFSRREFKDFMFAQSQFLPDTLDMIRKVKDANRVHIAAVSNESRELTEFRIEHFNLHTVFDVFVSSCFVGMRKPDVAIYRLALDLTQARPDQVVYVDDRSMFADVARSLGIHSIKHENAADTREKLGQLGLSGSAD